MIKTILKEAGFIENKTFRETRFLKAPSSSYCVYMDSYFRSGADFKNNLIEHNYTIELYAYSPDKRSELAIEQALDIHHLEYSKEDRYWIEEEQLYQTIYEFTVIEKR